MPVTTGYCWRRVISREACSKHAEADGGFAAASRIGAAASRNNLDDGGESTGEVSEKWIRNQAGHGFFGLAKALPGMTGLCRRNECEKDSLQAQLGVYSPSLGKQNGNSD